MHQNDEVVKEEQNEQCGTKQDDKECIARRRNKQQNQLKDNSQFAHPIYKTISATNGRINRMRKEELIEALQYLQLNTRFLTLD